VIDIARVRMCSCAMGLWTRVVMSDRQCDAITRRDDAPQQVVSYGGLGNRIRTSPGRGSGVFAYATETKRVSNSHFYYKTNGMGAFVRYAYRPPHLQSRCV
jgi:hypothetical protein